MKILYFVCAMLIAPISALAMNHGHSPSHPGMQSPFETVEQDGLILEKFWARARIGMAPNSAAYGRIRITGNEDRLVEARTPVATTVELHEHIKDNGVMRMREVEGGFPLTASTPLHMKPGGYHIMLLGLTGTLDANTTLPLELVFESGRILSIDVPVLDFKPMKH